MGEPELFNMIIASHPSLHYDSKHALILCITHRLPVVVGFIAITYSGKHSCDGPCRHKEGEYFPKAKFHSWNLSKQYAYSKIVSIR